MAESKGGMIGIPLETAEQHLRPGRHIGNVRTGYLQTRHQTSDITEMKTDGGLVLRDRRQRRSRDDSFKPLRHRGVDNRRITSDRQMLRGR